MKQFQYKITDENGIHARPAGLLAKALQGFESDITITKDGKTVSAKKLIALMGMGIKKDDLITITVSGADEDAAAAETERFMKENL